MIHLAIIGCGGMANTHAGQIKHVPELKVVAAVDIIEQKAVDYAARHFPEARAYSSFEALLADPPEKLDAVLIASPHTAHYLQAKQSMIRGWHVLCEKPMVTSSPHAYDLWQTSKDTGRLLAVAYQACYSAEYRAIQQLRENGSLGKIQLVNGWLAQGWMKPTVGTWRQDPALSGGGQMYDSGAHVLNAIMWIVNEPVVEVSCMYDTCGTPVDINGVAIMRFASGAMGSVAIGGNCPNWDVAISVQTDTMTLRTGPHGAFLEANRLGRKFYPAVPFSDEPATFTPVRNFADSILGHAKPQAPARYGVLLSALMDAMYMSAAEQKLIKVQPVPDSL
jgi:predicted dehydrogenase